MPALKKPLKKVGVLIVAIPLLIAGIAMLALPGPGLLAIFLAFALLASEFESLQPYKKKLEARLKQVTGAAKGQGGLHAKKKVLKLLDRSDVQRAGAWLWLVSLQYFIVQAYVASRWTYPFSLANNTISDLGNTVCATYNGRFVCSPDYFLMNFSFAFLGMSQLAGAIILYLRSPRGRLEQLAFAAMAIAGIGTVLVGVFPENTSTPAHGIAAALPLVVGNIGLILFGFSRWLPVALRWYSRIAGVLALIAIALFAANVHTGIGSGALERLAAYPQTIWLVMVGGYLLFLEAKRVRYNRTHHGRKQHDTT